MFEQYGITDQLAPPLGITEWRDAAGQPMVGYDLAQMPGQYKLIFCFQDNCPGCHRTGFPTLIKLVEAFRGSRIISFAAIQTVFEEFADNTVDRGFANQTRYALPIPFGHDAGPDGSGSLLMQRYRSGGTPWFILINPEGVVLFNHYHLDADRLADSLRQLAQQRPEQAPVGVLTWADVLRLVRDGNPPPPRRVERSDAEWRAVLSPEQFYVTRQKGTERAHSSGMCALFEPGRYACACCGTELFDAGDKFDSHSGWPSFTQAIAPGLVAYHGDHSHGMQRIETTCNICDAHLGHVFPDGPAPSGLRYCINALALIKR
jgi:methionine-R-sulfoxide reductase